MTETLEEAYGQLLLSQLFTHIWFGNWDEYEATTDRLPADLKDEFPFHKHYKRETTELWYDNYFNIPGVYFIPPYTSSYDGKSEEDVDRSKHDLLCLIGTFDKLGFYYPLEQDEFPDHIGSLTAFITAAISEEINAREKGDQELVGQIIEVKEEIYYNYIRPNIEKLWENNEQKVTDPFFKQFIPYYINSMEEMFHK